MSTNQYGHAVFDPVYYAFLYPEYKNTDAIPILHYLKYGWKQGKNPSPFFNTIYYLALHKEILDQRITPLEHYELSGQNAGALPFQALLDSGELPPWLLQHIEDICYYLSWRAGLFDPGFYFAQNPDIGSEKNALCHFRDYGHKERRNPSAYFDTDFYIREYMADAPKQNPLVHAVLCSLPSLTLLPQLASGALEREAISTGVFDPEFHAYATGNIPAGADPFLNYVIYGYRLGHNPAPQFTTNFYILETGCQCNPVLHYLALEERPEQTSFAPTVHLDELPEYGLEHIGDSAAWLCVRENLIDAQWYAEKYPDVGESGMPAIEHFRTYGFKEGRNPSGKVNNLWYGDEYLNSDEKCIPLWHYLREGKTAGNRLAPDKKTAMLEGEIDALLTQIAVLQEKLAASAPIPAKSQADTEASDPEAHYRDLLDAISARLRQNGGQD